MAPVTDAELSEIEKACAAATPGPWRWEKDQMVSPWQDEADMGLARDRGEEAWSRMEELKKAYGEHPAVWEPIIETDSGCYGPREVDRQFIASTRAWLPALVVEVRRLRGALAEVREWARPENGRGMLLDAKLLDLKSILDRAE